MCQNLYNTLNTIWYEKNTNITWIHVFSGLILHPIQGMVRNNGSIMCKEALKVSTTPHKFLLQFKN